MSFVGNPVSWNFSHFSHFCLYQGTVVDVKSHYSKIKRSKMDISNIYLKTKVLKYLHIRQIVKIG